MRWRSVFRLKRAIVGMALLVMALAGIDVPAHAADICNAVALVDIPDTITGYGLKKGEIDDAVTQYNVDANGEGQFCSHGGGCYPRYLIKGGKKVEALRLTNCKIGAAEPAIAGLPDDGSVTYDIEVDRSKNSAAALKIDDVDNALLNLGMCSACAGNAAYLYIHSPASECGSKVANALAGDKSAIAELQNNPDYCQASLPASAAAAASDSSAPEAPPTSAAIPAADVPLASTTSSPGPKVLIWVAIGVAAILYFVPSVIAYVRRKRNAKAILALNLFLGWSFLGWVAALIWSLLADSTGERQ